MSVVNLKHNLKANKAQALVTFEGSRIEVDFGGNYHLINAARLQRLPQIILKAVRKQFLIERRGEESDG